jgi:predicted secreted protein
MPAAAAYALTLDVDIADTFSGGNDEVAGITQLAFNPTRDMLDSTAFADSGVFRSKVPGLADGTIQMSGNFEPANAPQILVRTQFLNGGDLWALIKFDGTNGFKVKTKVSDFTVDASVDGLATFSATLAFNATPSVVP